MLVKLSKNTFVRFIDEETVYITNQLTRFDRTYNETGSDFLHEISRSPRNIHEIIESLSALYGKSVTRQKLEKDFSFFVDDLVQHKFLVVGTNEKEIEKNDLSFSYSMENPKTLMENYFQDTCYEVN